MIAGSETYPEREIREARALARKLGVRHRVIHTEELENPDFVENPPLRCYHCKRELFSTLEADRRGRRESLTSSTARTPMTRAISGRAPKAGRELGIRSPLKEAGLTKAEIRALSRQLGLPTWNKPSLACLASRFPYQYADRDQEPETGGGGRGRPPGTGLRPAPRPPPRRHRPDRGTPAAEDSQARVPARPGTGSWPAEEIGLSLCHPRPRRATVRAA